MLAHCRETDISLFTFEYLHTQIGFQFLDRQAERRLCYKTTLRRAPEIAFAADGDDISEFA
jgi:hypothetical protein